MQRLVELAALDQAVQPPQPDVAIALELLLA